MHVRTDSEQAGNLPPFNPKNVVRTEGPGYWSRRLTDAEFDHQRSLKRRRLDATLVENDAVEATKEASKVTNGPSAIKASNGNGEAREETEDKVIVIHPGGRILRIGRASDVIPLPVQNVIARRLKSPLLTTKYTPNPVQIDDTLEEKIGAIRSEIKNRMKHFKIRHQLNSSTQAVQYNSAVQPEIMQEINDPFRIEWTDTSDRKDEFFVGEHVGLHSLRESSLNLLCMPQALKIANPEEQGFSLRWPISRGTFNTENYNSAEEVVSDIQDILTSILSVDFEIPVETFKVSLYSSSSTRSQ